MRHIMERAIGSWLLVCSGLVFVASGGMLTKDNFSSVPFWAVLLATAAVFSVVSLLVLLLNRRKAAGKGAFPGDLDTLIMVVFAWALSLLVSYHSEDIYVSLACILVSVVSVYYGLSNGMLRLKTVQPSRRFTMWAVLIMGLALAGFIAAVTVLRYVRYSNSTYDFGIFAQMFENMRNGFLPVTTCERDQLLSHFAVHISPVYYLILPIYWLLPHPITLQVLQALIVAAGIIPLVLLCRHKGLSRLTTLLFAGVYCFYPALSGGTFYDLHENCFLVPLLLLTFFFYEKKKMLPMYLMALLTLTVKEDAPVYIAFFAIYIMLCDKKWKHGIALFAGSAGWFAGALMLLRTFGEGSMDYRYENFMSDSSVISMIFTVIKNPGVVLSEAFVAEKFGYIMLMLLPLCFLPLITKKLPRMILLCPMLLINIMPDYLYQYDIFLQYSFGTLAFLFYAAILNYSEMDRIMRHRVLPVMCIAGTMLFGGNYAKVRSLFHMDSDKKYMIETFDEVLASIPEDASVSATGYLVPHLYDHAVLYDISYTDKLTEYAVIDLREDDAGVFILKYQREGYTLLENRDGLILVYHRDAAAADS